MRCSLRLKGTVLSREGDADLAPLMGGRGGDLGG